MFRLCKAGVTAGVAGVLTAALTTGVVAGGSVKDGPAAGGRQFGWAVTIGGTSDYVFRGVSQSSEDPAVQGGVDFTYGILYLGAWGSNIDFDGAPKANVEVDYVAGIKPVWNGVTFDLGVIYYTYPGAKDAGAELDYLELKLGASGTLMPNLTAGGTIFYSPDYTFETGPVWTFEGSVAYEFRKVGMFIPTFSALIGYQTGKASEGYLVDGLSADDDFVYWNAGVSLAIDKFTLDFRYWDTDIGTANGGVCASTGLCDERFVFTAKFTY